MNLRKSFGFSLVETTIALGLMAGGALMLANMLSESGKHTKALEEKITSMDVKNLLSDLMMNPEYCRCLFNTKTYNTSAKRWNNFITKFDSSYQSLPIPCTPGAVPPHLSVGGTVPGSRMKVQSISMDPATESVSGSGKYVGQVRVKYDPGSLTKPLKDMTFPLSFTLDLTTGSPGSRKVQSCALASTSQSPYNTSILGYGKIQTSGCGNVLCFPINYTKGWTPSKTIGIGNVYYPGATGSWGAWSVFFKNMNPGAGTGEVCMDSGGWHGCVGAESIGWVVYGLE